MQDQTIAYCRLLEADEVAERLGLPGARERHKYGCPACGSSDALHCYPSGGRGAYCYSCETPYDPIALVEQATGRDFLDAVRWLGAEFGFDVDAGESSVDHRKRIADKVERKRRERERRRRERLEGSQSLYQSIYEDLRLGQAGRVHLKSRGIPPKVAEHLGVRSVERPEEWGALLERHAEWPDDLQRAGLEGRGDEGTYPVPWRAPFLVFGYRDCNGADDEPDPIEILRFRHIDGAGDPNYLSPLRLGPTSPYLSCATQYADDYETLYICEGEIDALSVVYGAGMPAMAAPGAATWETSWCEGFRWFGRVVVLCDGDEAGQRFAASVRDACSERLGGDWTDEHLRCQQFAEGVDANDALQAGQLAEALGAERGS